MTGSQVRNAEEDRHKLVIEYKDALQPADFYQNFKQRGIRSVQLIPHIEFDDRGELTAASMTEELWGQFLIALFEWQISVVYQLSFSTPPCKNGAGAKNCNPGEAVRDVTGIVFAHKHGMISRTTCFVLAIKLFIPTRHRTCG